MPHKKGHCLTDDGNIIEDCIERMSDEEVSKHSDKIAAYRRTKTDYALDGSDY